VCAIRFKATKERGYKQISLKDTNEVQVSSSIYINIVSSESFIRIPSLWAAIVNVSSLAVVLQLPKLLIRLFCTKMLGHLSAVYKQSLERIFDISDYCAGWTMRVALIASSLYPMTPRTHLHLGYGAVPLAELHSMLRLALANHDSLDEADVKNIVNFAWSQIFNPAPACKKDVGAKSFPYLNSIKSMVGVHTKSTDISLPGDSQVRIGHATELCTTHDVVSFGTVAALLDQDRDLGALESIFMPRDLLKFTHRRKHKQATQRSVESTRIGNSVYDDAWNQNISGLSTSGSQAAADSDATLRMASEERIPVTHGSDKILRFSQNADVSLSLQEKLEEFIQHCSEADSELIEYKERVQSELGKMRDKLDAVCRLPPERDNSQLTALQEQLKLPWQL